MIALCDYIDTRWPREPDPPPVILDMQTITGPERPADPRDRALDPRWAHYDRTPEQRLEARIAELEELVLRLAAPIRKLNIHTKAGEHGR